MRYGSGVGDVLHLRLTRARPSGWLQVEITQPRVWDWRLQLGAARQSELIAVKRNGNAGHPSLFGGTAVMLLRADEIEGDDQGRRLLLRFSPEAKRPSRPEPAAANGAPPPIAL